MNEQSPDLNREIQFIISSDLKNLELLGEGIKAICALLFTDQKAIDEIELGILEATTNCIKHAYQGDKTKDICLTLNLSPQHLTATIVDTGLSFDPARLESLDPSAWTIDPNNIDELPESGMGLHLIKSTMDTVTYCKEETRNIMTLTKQVRHDQS